MIGRYELLGRIGAGGMGEVYLSRVRGTAGFERLFVIKRLLPELAASPQQVEMFLDEARTLAKLQHANIVQVIDVGTDGGAYMVLELLRGRDLNAVLRQLARRSSALPLEHAVAIAQAICLALDHAHRHAVIHRDVSPHNVFVTFDGAVKLLDFGIAKVSGRRDLTRTGTIKGKLGYMSPEQCRGQPITAASDIFSTAIVLFEMVTGQRLFAADSDFEVLRATIEGELPRPAAIVPSCSPTLEAIILRGLAREPRERYPTALAMHDELAALARSEGLAGTAVALGALVSELFRDDEHDAPVDTGDAVPTDANTMIAAHELERRTAMATGGRRTLTQTAPRRSRIKPAIAAGVVLLAFTAGGVHLFSNGDERDKGTPNLATGAAPAPPTASTPRPEPAPPQTARPADVSPPVSPPASPAAASVARPTRRAAVRKPDPTAPAPVTPSPVTPEEVREEPAQPTPAVPPRRMPDVPAAADDLPQ